MGWNAVRAEMILPVFMDFDFLVCQGRAYCVLQAHRSHKESTLTGGMGGSPTGTDIMSHLGALSEPLRVVPPICVA